MTGMAGTKPVHDRHSGQTVLMVATGRLELPRSFDHWFLKPARATISSRGHHQDNLFDGIKSARYRLRMAMTINQLIHSLTTMRDSGEKVGDYEVFMVPDDDTMVPVESPIMIGGELCLYSEKLF
jgi:hypothetical protein